MNNYNSSKSTRPKLPKQEAVPTQFSGELPTQDQSVYETNRPKEFTTTTLAEVFMTLAEVLFSFDGRIGRRTYWLIGFLPLLVLYIIVGIIVHIIELRTSPGTALSIEILLRLFLMWPSLAVAVKRLHDRNKSGWWILIGLIPIVGQLWAFIEFGFLEGTEGPNRFGSDTDDPGAELPGSMPKWMKYMLAILVGVPVLLCSVGIVVISVNDLFKRPRDVVTTLSVPPKVRAFEEFEIEVRFTNNADRSEVLRDIDISQGFLDGVIIVAATPQFEESFRGAASGDMNYKFRLPLEARSETSVVLKAMAKSPGHYEGSIDFCINTSSNCTERFVEIFVE